MKLNIAYPATGCQKLIEVSVIRTLIVMSHASVHCTHSTAVCRQFQIEDDRKLRVFFDKKMAQEAPGDSLGDEWKGYVFKIGGGNDKQGKI